MVCSTGIIRLLSPMLALLAAAVVCAGEPMGKEPSQAAFHAEVVQALGQLDHAEFLVRRQAVEKFQRWLDRPELQPALAAEFQQALIDPKLSFEVRWQLERWSRSLPKPDAEPLATATPRQIEELVGQLDDDSFAVRVGARRRLQALAKNPAAAGAVLTQAKQRLDDEQFSLETRSQLKSLWKEARGVWLVGGGVDDGLPAVADAQIERWVAMLAAPAKAETAGGWPGHVRAESELLDLLARDAYLPRVKQMLEAQLATCDDRKAVARLKSVLDWTRPAMVAEFWQEHRHTGEQHLLVGVPSQAAGFPRASHFDRIDDNTAHCVSGVTLSPGDYPVGVAFPHPRSQVAFFHLVNLPTPRRRMAYTYATGREPAVRLAEISRRTCQRWLGQQHQLTLREITLLEQLDYEEVSRFAGRYFNLVPDGPMLADGEAPPVDVEDELLRSLPSGHNAICLTLAWHGTKEAVPGLLEAIEKGRFQKSPGKGRDALPWCAALAIAVRDPWPEVEPWLVGLVERTDPFFEERNEGPDLGATAAAILLSRRQESPSRFGLRAVGQLLEKPAVLDGYSFASSNDRDAMLQWCKTLPPRNEAATP